MYSVTSPSACVAWTSRTKRGTIATVGVPTQQKMPDCLNLSATSLRIYTNDEGTRRFNVHFTSEVVPHNHTNHNFITIYYRVWGTSGDYYHRTCEKDATDTTYFISGGGHGQYFQNNTDYEVHLRWGDRGNGSGPTVP